MTVAPLGKREDQNLEFKGRDVLQNLEKVSREVVAMLNSGSGGVIWLGIREDNGFAVEAEPIDRAETACDRIRDHLVDAIEPSPSPEQIRIEPVEVQTGTGNEEIIRVSVGGDASRIYAQLGRGGCRYFVTRIGNRVRPMTREEVFGGQSNAPSLSPADVVEGVEQRGGPLLAVLVRPHPELNLDNAELESFEELLTDYSPTESRRVGWNFVNPWVRPKPAKDRLVQGDEDIQVTEIHRNGDVRFRTPLERTARQRPDEKRMHPHALMEFPTSVARLAARIFQDKTVRQVLVGVGLLGIEGWSVKPHDRYLVDWDIGQEPWQDRDLIKTASFPAKEFFDSPDRCAYHLVRRIFWDFGYKEKDIPPGFDHESGRLVLR